MTHILTGVCLARAGLNRRAAYATLTLAVAAELPDIDVLWSVRGPVESFTHHRGITHTFLGLPFEAALLVGAVWGVHRWRMRTSGAKAPLARRSYGAWEAVPSAETSHPAKGPNAGGATPSAESGGGTFTAAPVRWGVLYLLALLGLLSHLLLDYTNNYGIRPFFPFNPRWYAGSFVFIVDPLILLLLVTGLVAPLLFQLISSEIGAPPRPFRGRGWAVFALLSVVALWTLRAVEHQRAVDLTMAQAVALPLPPGAAEDAPPRYVQPVRALASPGPVNPFAWTAVADLGTAYQMAEVDLWTGTWTAGQEMLPKPPQDMAARAAYGSPLGRAYFDWSPMPLVTAESLENGDTWVTMRDPRFLGGWLKDHGHSALTATVRVRPDGSVAEQAMDGRVER